MSGPSERKGPTTGRAMNIEKVVFLILTVAVLVGLTTYHLASRKGTGVVDIAEKVDDNSNPEVAALIERFQNHPDDTVAMKMLGNHYYDAGNYDMADMFYKSYLRVNPHNTDVIVDLGTALYYMNRGEEALGHYQEALQIDPDHRNALFNAGVVKDAMGDRDGAVLSWRRFIEVAGDDPHTEPIREMIAEYEGKLEKGANAP